MVIDAEALKTQGVKKVVRNTATKAKSRELEVGEITPYQLRDWNGENLYIRNNTDNLLSFDDGQGHTLSLGGKETGEHISVLDINIARNPGIQRRWRAGFISVSTDPDMEEELFLAETQQDKILAEDLNKKTPHTVVSAEANTITVPAQNFEPNW